MFIKNEVKIELPIIWLDSLPERHKQFLDAVRGECRLTKDTHDFKDGSANLEVVLDDCNEAIGDDGDVNLYAYGILGLSPEPLDLEMLLNPFEQLHLPPIFIEESDVFGRKIVVVSVVNETALEFWSIVDNPSDDSRIFLLILFYCESNALVFEDIGCPIQHAFSIDNLVCRLTLLPDDVESPEHIDAIESGEVIVSSVKHIASQRLIREPVHGADIMHLGIGNSVEHGYLCNDANLSVNPNTRLGASEFSPSEYGHAQVNGRGVNGIESAMQFKLFRDTSGLGNGHHVKSELPKDTMVSKSISLRQHLPVDCLVTRFEVFRLLGMGDCKIREFPEASTTHQLSEHQNQQMASMRHRPALGPVVVLGEYTPELPLREELYYLCKNECSYMHICSDLESDAKVGISKPGQGIGGLKRCA